MRDGLLQTPRSGDGHPPGPIPRLEVTARIRLPHGNRFQVNLLVGRPAGVLRGRVSGPNPVPPAPIVTLGARNTRIYSKIGLNKHAKGSQWGEILQQELAKHRKGNAGRTRPGPGFVLGAQGATPSPSPRRPAPCKGPATGGCGLDLSTLFCRVKGSGELDMFILFPRLTKEPRHFRG